MLRDYSFSGTQRDPIKTNTAAIWSLFCCTATCWSLPPQKESFTWNALTGALDVVVLRIVSRTVYQHACVQVWLSARVVGLWFLISGGSSLTQQHSRLSTANRTKCLQACSQSDGEAQGGREWHYGVPLANLSRSSGRPSFS